MEVPQPFSPNLQSPSFLVQPPQPSLSTSSYNLPPQNAVSVASQEDPLSPMEKARREERARDPFFRAYDNIRAHVYANLSPEDQSYLAELSVADALSTQPLKKAASRPDNDLDDLTAYIQGQLQGKDGRDRERSAHLVPVPLRYRLKPVPFEEFDATKKNEKKKVTDKTVLFNYQFPDENWKRDKYLLDEFMGRGSHAPPRMQLDELLQKRMNETVTVNEATESEDFPFRRIFPEDPAWKLTPIERLSETCLKIIQNNFHDMPYQMAALPTELQQRFIADLPVASEINLYLAADYFHNENYWERSCRARWGSAAHCHTHGSWKLTYIERGFQELIENYVPLQSDPNLLLNDLLNIGEYVLQLRIEQLLPPVRHTFGNFAAMIDAQLTKHINFTEPVDESQVDPETHRRDSSVLQQIPMAEEVKKYVQGNKQFPAVQKTPWSDKAKIKFQRLLNRELDLNSGIDEGDRVLLDITRELDDTPAHPRTMNPFLAADHINLVPVVANMPHLMDLQLRYGIVECGMNFSWRLYQFTLNDARRLAEALVICASLRRLCLAYCNINDAKGAIVCSALLDHPNLAILELQCNKLGNDTAAVIARMIKRSEVLNKVDLSENQVGVDGAKALARALVRGVSLRILNLHFNEIGDLGAEALFLVLKSCITFLQQLMISGNKISGAVVDLLTDAMKVNRKLEKYDLSVNELEGVTVARKIQEALAQSHHIQEFSIRENLFSADFETCIQEIIARNQDARQEQILVELEHTFDFNIKHIKFPSEEQVKRNSDEDSSSSEES
ncbi:dynein regulatory complex subunit 5-like [Paramacrobiotus metropolitanus]|uniref:dynein regulatory complex subunit 5-like n=1 Tax=Paramacrobiotus metropolitanus TaxID=2943436 RepID=UPI002445ABF2|nr:dynein regulatory complex subunit 5-like [Paramacrobiotus metropolitanus]